MIIPIKSIDNWFSHNKKLTRNGLRNSVPLPGPEVDPLRYDQKFVLTTLTLRKDLFSGISVNNYDCFGWACFCCI
jgi:hypothetical protein